MFGHFHARSVHIIILRTINHIQIHVQQKHFDKFAEINTTHDLCPIRNVLPICRNHYDPRFMPHQKCTAMAVHFFKTTYISLPVIRRAIVNKLK